MQDVRIQELAAAAEVHLQSGGGFTFDPNTGVSVPPANVWAVSLAGYGRFFTEKPNDEDIVRYLTDRVKALEPCDGRKRFFGGWREKGKGYWLDLSVLIRGRKAAIRFGKKNKQYSICNLLTHEVITLIYHHELVQV